MPDPGTVGAVVLIIAVFAFLLIGVPEIWHWIKRHWKK